MNQPSPPPAWHRFAPNPAAGLLGLMALQMALSIYPLIRAPLWLDEAYSALLARETPAGIADHLVYDAGPPLYYLLLSAWRSVAGESEAALRSLSLAGALATTALIWLAMRRWTNQWTAWLAAAFWALNPLTIAYACEARNYTLLTTLAMAALVAWDIFCSKGNWRALAGWGAASLALVYTHNIGWFFMAGQIVLTPLRVGWSKRLWAFGTMVFGVILLYLPWTPVLLDQMQNTHQTIAWAEAFQTPWGSLLSLNAFLPGGWTPAFMAKPALPWPAQWGQALLWGALALWGVKSLGQEKHRSLRYAVMLGGLALVGLTAYSQAGQPVYLIGRTDFILLPLWCLLLAQGTAQLALPRLQWGAAGVYGVAAFITLGLQWSAPAPLNSENVAHYIASRGQPGGVVLCTGLTRPPMEYHLAPKGFSFVSYPADMANQLAHINERWYARHLDLAQEAHEAIQRAVQATAPRGMIWVVGSRRPVNEPLWQALRESNHLRGSHQPIQSPRMGLRKLNEPLFLLRYEVIQP